MVAPDGRWQIDTRQISVADAHAAEDRFKERAVCRYEPTLPALVLGRSQVEPNGLAHRAETEGLSVVRRRSGGGAVLVRADSMLWIDLFLPKADPLWVDDLQKSSIWLGGAWCRALAAMGIKAEVVTGPADYGLCGRAICFAGRTVGEVQIAGQKVVGISQRRSQSGSRFQSAALVGTDAIDRSVVPLVNLLGLGPADLLWEEIRRLVGTVEVDSDALFEAFVDAL